MPRPESEASVMCGRFGSTAAFSAQALDGLYGTRAKCLSDSRADRERAIAGGYALPSDRASLPAPAQQVQFPAA